MAAPPMSLVDRLFHARDGVVVRQEDPCPTSVLLPDIHATIRMGGAVLQRTWIVLSSALRVEVRGCDGHDGAEEFVQHLGRQRGREGGTRLFHIHAHGHLRRLCQHKRG